MLMIMIPHATREIALFDERSCFDREFAALGDKVPREICKSIRFMNLQW
jgi:hypothetical protein